MNPSTANPSAAEKLRPTDCADVDLWWGSYWGWALLPSWIVFALVAGTVAVLTWLPLRHTTFSHLIVIAEVIVILVVQVVRWSLLFFGRNYRLTNRQIIVEHGVFRAKVQRGHLADLTRVEVRADRLEQRLGISRIVLHFAQDQRPPLILEAVHDAEAVVTLIRKAMQELPPRMAQEPRTSQEPRTQ